jgi:hypothetical protein
MAKKVFSRTPAPALEYLKFSLKYLDTGHSDFELAKCCREFLACLVTEIHRYSQFTVDQFKDNDPNDWHRHKINFQSSSRTGFPQDPGTDELWTDEAWQFALSDDVRPPRAGWRVHGFVVGDVFYIVWLDPGHRLFPDKRYHCAQE